MMGFVHSMAVDADYNTATLQKVLTVLKRKSSTVVQSSMEQFERLLQEV